MRLTRDTDLAQWIVALFRGARGGESLFWRPDCRAGSGGMTMKLLYPHCCGLDVHKFSLTACVRMQREKWQTCKVVRRFGAMTADWRPLAH